MVDMFLEQDKAGRTNMLLRQQLTPVCVEVETNRAELETAREFGTIAAVDARTSALG